MQRKEITETDVADQLQKFRAENSAYKGPSFATISGFGSNGAIVHYRADDQTNKTLEEGSLLLVDSGGQYCENDAAGTTDITRTIVIGQPSDEMRRNFTLVLKGHIALAMAKFPAGTTGAQIDTLARQPLWNEGLDYAHGTGHGLGAISPCMKKPQVSHQKERKALNPACSFQMSRDIIRTAPMVSALKTWCW